MAEYSYLEILLPEGMTEFSVFLPEGVVEYLYLDIILREWLNIHHLCEYIDCYLIKL